MRSGRGRDHSRNYSSSLSSCGHRNRTLLLEAAAEESFVTQVATSNPSSGSHTHPSWTAARENDDSA
uniref:Uncharacterized protein n=1 Tax=Steinernema glaseri TaxID=37863 RepID=A0A1I7YZE0_9BILA